MSNVHTVISLGTNKFKLFEISAMNAEADKRDAGFSNAAANKQIRATSPTPNTAMSDSKPAPRVVVLRDAEH